MISFVVNVLFGVCSTASDSQRLSLFDLFLHLCPPAMCSGPLSSNHQITPVSRSQTALFLVLHLSSEAIFLLLFGFLLWVWCIVIIQLFSVVMFDSGLVVDISLAFSALVSKPFFAQSLSFHSHLFLAQDHLEFDYSVFGSQWHW